MKEQTELTSDTVVFEKKYTVDDIESFTEYMGEERKKFTKEQLDELSVLLDDAVSDTLSNFFNSN